MVTYDEALAESSKLGLSRCSDAAAMAGFCAHDLQFVMGAVSPRLTWEGAQRKGLTFLELARLCVREPAEAEALQWEK